MSSIEKTSQELNLENKPKTKSEAKSKKKSKSGFRSKSGTRSKSSTSSSRSNSGSKSKSKSKSNSNVYNASRHRCRTCSHYFRGCRCHRKMFKSQTCMLIKIVIMIVLIYIIYKLFLSQSSDDIVNQFRLTKRF
jgi:hypothetical protein